MCTFLLAKFSWDPNRRLTVDHQLICLSVVHGSLARHLPTLDRKHLDACYQQVVRENWPLECNVLCQIDSLGNDCANNGAKETGNQHAVYYGTAIR